VALQISASGIKTKKAKGDLSLFH